MTRNCLFWRNDIGIEVLPIVAQAEGQALLFSVGNTELIREACQAHQKKVMGIWMRRLITPDQ